MMSGGDWLRVRSESANSCAEVQPWGADGGVAIRSSLEPGTVVYLDATEWQALVAGIGELDERLRLTCH
jgi:hypothetical protein